MHIGGLIYIAVRLQAEQVQAVLRLYRLWLSLFRPVGLLNNDKLLCMFACKNGNHFYFRFLPRAVLLPH